ncbi:MAG TPA: hypothetical protein VJU16_08650 [Planctomycetota bacterium]|nr:hypothetical protein [Planctomycetota bacterium]
MPDAQEILEHLATASRDARWLALAWHLLVAATLAALAAGCRPPRSHVGPALSAPLLSASAIAWSFGNPFNGMMLFAAALVLAVPRGRPPLGEATLPGPWVRTLGFGLVGFAWVYPHFFEEARFLDYLFFSPLGVIPCPTLALVLGFVLLFDGGTSKGRTIVAAATGAFYGLFGWLVLDVTLDLVLLLGSAVVLVRALASTAGSGE